MKKIIIMLVKEVFIKPINIFWIFIVPIVLMLIMGYSIGYEQTLSGMLFLPIITTSFMVVPEIIRKYKNSEYVIENFGNKLKSYKLTFTIPIFFFCLLMVWITILILLFVLLFLPYYETGFIVRINYLANGTFETVKQLSVKNLFENNKDVLSYVEMFFYFGYATILGIAYSFAINAFVKKKSTLLIVNSSLFLYNFIFIGLIVPYPIIQQNEVLFGFSFLAPFKYLASMNYVSMWSGPNDFLNVTGSRVFDFDFNFLFRDRNLVTNSFGIPNTVILFSGIEKLMNFTIPFILISVCISLASSHYHWFDTNTLNFGPISKKDIDIKFTKSGWILYYCFLPIIFGLLFAGIILVIMANKTVTSLNVYQEANIDINIIAADYNGVTSDIYTPSFWTQVNANRESRMATELNQFLQSHNLTLQKLDSNLEKYNTNMAIGTSFVTLMIISLSIWSGLFMKRIYLSTQIKVVNRFNTLNVLDF